MSIHLICGDFYFTSSISFWNKIRETISIATFDYIVKYRNDLYNEREDQNINPCQSLVKKIQLLSDLNNCIHDIRFSLFQTNPMMSGSEDSIHISLLKMYTYYLDILTVLGVAGIFAMTNKSDSEGYYSPGNSADIVNTMKITMPYIENDNILSSMQELIDLFLYSSRENMIVAIASNENNPTTHMHNTYIISLLTNSLYQSKKHLLEKKRTNK